MMEILRYKITYIKTIVERVKVIRMEPLSDNGADELSKGISYSPGQFLMLHAFDEKGNSTVHRPYSIASSPEQPFLEFCIKMIDGEMTSILDKAKEGDVYGVEGPMGHFEYSGENKCAFIAGGTGLAPFISMLRFVKDKKMNKTKKDGRKFILFYSGRKKDAMLYYDELMELDKNKSIDVVITITREEPKGWKGECGRIDEAMIKKYAKDLNEFSWYLCGPLKMTMALRDCLIKNGVDSSKVKFEGWG